MLNTIKMISELRKEVESLRKEVQTLKDALVKQKRDYNDLFYNLDIDNVPALREIKDALKIGPVYEDESGNKSETTLTPYQEEDGYSLGYSRGAKLSTVITRNNGSQIHSEVKVGRTETLFNSYGVAGDNSREYDNVSVGIERDEGEGAYAYAFMRVKSEGKTVELRVDRHGVHTTESDINTDWYP